MSTDTPLQPDFDALSLSKPVRKALDDIGYEAPSPIQAQTIPLLMEGKDLIGQAQTGTGKTAAFALPILSRIDIKKTAPQALILVPTRELAIQVAEAVQRYGSHIKNLHVLPIYGGQEYGGQLRSLKRGVHVVVGTPGRIMDHMRRGSLILDTVQHLILDEADEMLRMGFIDDVEWILEQTPDERQIALFSATLPPAIRKIAKRHLREPESITIKMKAATAEGVHQRYWLVSRMHKLDALTRILEAEPFDGMLIFVRTKSNTVELAERLAARGFTCAPLNGDIRQATRERTVRQFKEGKIDILIGTDVAARGLDVDRISHVVNYDIPYDAETYIHRVGRTGRAGRTGEAILFVSPRERNMLSAIEKASRQRIERMELPSTDAINTMRVTQFKNRITETITNGKLEFFEALVEDYYEETHTPALQIAAALAKMAHGDKPFLLKEAPPLKKEKPKKDTRTEKTRRRENAGPQPLERGMERYRLEVGQDHGVQPKNIVGAIANEAGLRGGDIRNIDIYTDYTTLDLPVGMPAEIFSRLQNTWVMNRQLQLTPMEEPFAEQAPPPRRKPNKKPGARPQKNFGKKANGKTRNRKPATDKKRSSKPKRTKTEK